MKRKTVVMAAVSAAVVAGAWGRKRLLKLNRRLREKTEYRRAFTKKPLGYCRACIM